MGVRHEVEKGSIEHVFCAPNKHSEWMNLRDIFDAGFVIVRIHIVPHTRVIWRA